MTHMFWYNVVYGDDCSGLSVDLRHPQAFSGILIFMLQESSLSLGSSPITSDYLKLATASHSNLLYYCGS